MQNRSFKFLYFPMFALLLVTGCASTRTSAKNTPDRTVRDYDSFQDVSPACMDKLKTHVEGKYREYSIFKGAINSKEPRFMEAVFAKTENNADYDSVVIVKFDTLCGIQRSYLTKMSITE